MKIAVLGLGAMGSRVARRLIEAGHDVTVYSRSASRGEGFMAIARVARTAREAVESADLVIAMVTDDAASRELWLDPEQGALLGMEAGAIAIESSTLTPEWVRELDTRIVARGAQFLDAPVIGSRPQAEAGQLIHLVGGEKETVERVRGALSAVGGALYHVGPVGTGALMKLAVNALFAIQVASVAEIMALLERAGLKAEMVAGLLGNLPVTSPAAKGAAALIAARNFAPLFPIDLVVKDLNYALCQAGRNHLSVPMTTAAQELYRQARAKGHGGDNITGVARVYERVESAEA
jgi:3-hydroxyisobutyrate dehydrogenase-like beta-hydroxyacid dehydrogenase